jgi:nitrous oxide reductase accessory protein NosL
LKRRLLLRLVGVAAVAAFAGLFTLRTAPSQKPFNIKVGQDRCRRCGMFISRLEYAAGILLADAFDWHYYDDLGCFAMDYVVFEAVGKRVIDAKVVDFKAKRPVDAKAVFYVTADPKVLWTPMSYGFVALEKAEDAREVAEKYGGTVVSFEGLLEWARKRV